MLAVSVGVTDETSVRNAGAASVRFSRIDEVVNNAGYGLMGAIEEVDAPELEDRFKPDFFGGQGYAGATSDAARSALWLYRQHFVGWRL
jgi:NAD(P)-dependent dehydrogenase (short-subunit alcohol dehydrogenase family)